MKRGLRIRVALLSCLAGVAGVGLHADAQGQQGTIVVQGGTLIDGNGGAPIANSVIVIQGNRITAVGRAGQVQIPAGAQTVNATGKWVLPSLIDAKCNWNWEYGEAYLHWGVTACFVSGPRNDQGQADRDAINHGIYAGPRLFEAIIGIRGPGADGKKPDAFTKGDFNRIARTADENRAAVKAYIDGGADFLAWVDGDGPPEIFAPAVKDALNAGKGVAFRSMGPQSRVREVAAMGDGIVFIHTGNVGTQIAKDPAKWKDYIGLPPDAYSDMDDTKAAEMIQYLIAHKAYLEPDLMAADRGFHKNWARVQQEDKEFYSDPEMLAYYPKQSMYGVWENVKSPETYMTPAQIQVRAAGFKNHMAFVKRYVAAGGKVVAASDVPQSPPGLGLHQEITALVEDAGLTPMQAIQASTKWVAEGFKQPDLGIIGTGKLADILIVDADPQANIMNLRKVNTVIKDGKIVDRAYHSGYRGGMFALKDNDDDAVVAATDWAEALKKATWRPNAQNGGFANAGGIDSLLSPTPAIEAISLHTVIRKSPDTPLTITGFNFVRGSRVYYDDIALPTEVVSRTELRVTVPENLLARAGLFPIVVKNPEPYATPDWGKQSNSAYLLVPFEFTTKWSQNAY